MRYLIAIILLAANAAWAETPAERAEMYFADIESLNFTAAARHFDAGQLNEFRAMMEFYKQIPAEVQSGFIQTFFGPGVTAESLEALSDTDFFAGIFNFIMMQAEAAGGLNFDGLEILGEVREGEDISHLVTRNRISIGAMDIEAMEVVSLRRTGEEWRILMSGKIRGLPEQLRAAFSETGT